MKRVLVQMYAFILTTFLVSVFAKAVFADNIQHPKNHETIDMMKVGKNVLSCENDSDCICVGNSDGLDGCGKSGQMWKCLKDHTCRLILESQKNHWENLSIKYLEQPLYCEQDKDCAIREGVCGFQAMNLFFDNSKLLEMQAYADCMKSIRYQDLRNPECDNYQCIVEEVKTE